MSSPYNPNYPQPGPGYPPNAGPGYPPHGGPGYPPLPPHGAMQHQPGYPPGPGPYEKNMYDNPPPAGYSYPPLPVPVDPRAMPVTSQPMGAGGDVAFYDIQRGYVGGPSMPLNVPPGLEYLAHVDSLYVKQKVELLEAFLGCETNNKYKIKNAAGQDIFTAKEDNDCCTRNCCGPLRPFEMNITDASEREVIHLSRPLACASCCCPCWLQTMEVFSPPGSLAGTIEQEWSLCEPKFVVKNSTGEVVLRIEGPFCTFSLCGDVEFQILSKDGSAKVGKISKKWSGLLREAFTDADNFGIQFPMDLDVRMKAVMLGACLLIDFMFFEKSGNQEGDGIGML